MDVAQKPAQTASRRRDSLRRMLELERQAQLERIHQSHQGATHEASPYYRGLEARRRLSDIERTSAIEAASDLSSHTATIQAQPTDISTLPVRRRSFAVSDTSSITGQPEVEPSSPFIPPRQSSRTSEPVVDTKDQDGSRRWFETPTPPGSDADSDAASSICHSPSWARYRREQKKSKKQQTKYKQEANGMKPRDKNDEVGYEGSDGASAEPESKELRKRAKLIKPPPLSRGFPKGRSSSVPPTPRGLFRRRPSADAACSGSFNLTQPEVPRHKRSDSIGERIRRSFDVTRITLPTTNGFIGGIKLERERQAVSDFDKREVTEQPSAKDMESKPDGLHPGSSKPRTESDLKGLETEGLWFGHVHRKVVDAFSTAAFGTAESETGLPYDGEGGSTGVAASTVSPTNNHANTPDRTNTWFSPEPSLVGTGGRELRPNEETQLQWLRQQSPLALVAAGHLPDRRGHIENRPDETRPQSSPAATSSWEAPRFGLYSQPVGSTTRSGASEDVLLPPKFTEPLASIRYGGASTSTVTIFPNTLASDIGSLNGLRESPTGFQPSEVEIERVGRPVSQPNQTIHRDENMLGVGIVPTIPPLAFNGSDNGSLRNILLGGASSSVLFHDAEVLNARGSQKASNERGEPLVSLPMIVTPADSRPQSSRGAPKGQDDGIPGHGVTSSTVGHSRYGDMLEPSESGSLSVLCGSRGRDRSPPRSAARAIGERGFLSFTEDSAYMNSSESTTTRASFVTTEKTSGVNLGSSIENSCLTKRQVVETPPDVLIGGFDFRQTVPDTRHKAGTGGCNGVNGTPSPTPPDSATSLVDSGKFPGGDESQLHSDGTRSLGTRHVSPSSRDRMSRDHLVPPLRYGDSRKQSTATPPLSTPRDRYRGDSSRVSNKNGSNRHLSPRPRHKSPPRPPLPPLDPRQVQFRPQYSSSSAPELLPPVPPKSADRTDSRPKSSQSGQAGSRGRGLKKHEHKSPLRTQPMDCPEEPLAKMFVECCGCRFYHDMPSKIYECMARGDNVVEGRASGVAIHGTVSTAVRCPWCGHGMTTRCCAGYAAVVYLKERVH